MECLVHRNYCSAYSYIGEISLLIDLGHKRYTHGMGQLLMYNPILSADVRVSWKCLPVTNTWAYIAKHTSLYRQKEKEEELKFFYRRLQISVSTVLTNACKTREQQNILAGYGAVRALAGLLVSPHADVQLPALKCLAYMVFGNEQVSRKSFKCRGLWSKGLFPVIMFNQAGSWWLHRWELYKG